MFIHVQRNFSFKAQQKHQARLLMHCAASTSSKRSWARSILVGSQGFPMDCEHSQYVG